MVNGATWLMFEVAATAGNDVREPIFCPVHEFEVLVESAVSHMVVHAGY